MMLLKDFARPYKELYAIHNHLLDFGFSPDDIFVGISDTPTEKNVLYAQLKAQGKEFNIIITPLGDDIIRKEVFDKWLTFINTIKTAKEEDIRNAMFSIAASRKDCFLSIAASLKENGFKIPRLEILQ